MVREVTESFKTEIVQSQYFEAKILCKNQTNFKDGILRITPSTLGEVNSILF